MSGNNKVLISGASGFLGNYIYQKILEQQSDIYTLGRTPVGRNHAIADFKTNDFELPAVAFSKVIHLAGKAHVYPRTEEEKQEFDQINFQATERLLQQLEKNQSFPKVFIFASTVAVYGADSGELISETKTQTPSTPYGSSKLNAEKSIIKWCDQHQVKYAILRLPLIAGTNPPGNLGTIKNAINKGLYFSIKNNQARKSIVLASDLAELTANHSWKQSGIYHLTDGIHPTFNEVEQAIEKALNKKIMLSLPLGLVQLLARCGDLAKSLRLPSPLNTTVIEKITRSLTFDDEKARNELNWNPNPVIPFLEKNI